MINSILLLKIIITQELFMFISATPPPCQLFGCYDEEDPSTHNNTAPPLIHRYFRIFTKSFTCDHLFCSTCLKAHKQSCNTWQSNCAYQGEEAGGWEAVRFYKINMRCPNCRAPERNTKVIKIITTALTILAFIALILLATLL